jgi:hypothetical protein
MFQEITNNDDEECCSICLETINKNYNKVITNCGHTFHCICLMKNVSINGFACPYCRTNIAEETKIYEYKEISIEENATSEEDSTSEEISITANTNEETPNIEILEYDRINFYNQAVMNEERRIYRRDYNMLAENNIINDNDLHNNLDAEIIRNNGIIRNNNEIIRNNDENIDRFYSYHLSRQNRITSSSVEALLQELAARLTSEHQVIEQGIQAALRINNIRIPPPATRLTYSTPFERSSFSQWRSSNI